LTIEYALKAHERELLAVPSVTRVRVGHVEDHDVIIVFVDLTDPDFAETASRAIPSKLEGYEVIVRPESASSGSAG
jgi:hypothetical protein